MFRSVVPLRVLSRTNPPLPSTPNSFRFRTSANALILHHFGANKSFTIRTYRHPSCNSFRIRTYKNTGGGGAIRLFRPSVSPCLCGKSHVLSSLEPLVPLFALFSALHPFVFNNLEPLSAKHSGWGGGLSM